MTITEKQYDPALILDARWLSDSHNQFAFIAKRGGRGDDWAVYITAAPMGSLDQDTLIERAITCGAKLPRAWAAAIFPALAADPELEYRD